MNFASTKFYLILLIIALSVSFGCNSPSKQAALDFCECWQPVADIASLQDTLKSKNMVDSLAAVNLIAIDKFEEARLCAEEKRQEYGEKATKNSFKEKARQTMTEKCPDVYQRIPKY